MTPDGNGIFDARDQDGKCYTMSVKDFEDMAFHGNVQIQDALMQKLKGGVE
jgi:hypothetical protein